MTIINHVCKSLFRLICITAFAHFGPLPVTECQASSRDVKLFSVCFGHQDEAVADKCRC